MFWRWPIAIGEEDDKIDRIFSQKRTIKGRSEVGSAPAFYAHDRSVGVYRLDRNVTFNDHDLMVTRQELQFPADLAEQLVRHRQRCVDDGHDCRFGRRLCSAWNDANQVGEAPRRAGVGWPFRHEAPDTAA